MNILIKGMDMPKEGEYYSIILYDNGNVYATRSGRLYEFEIDNIEAVEIPTPAEKIGHWIIDIRGNWACNICGNDPYHSNMKNMNYCPNCGARMKGE